MVPTLEERLEHEERAAGGGPNLGGTPEARGARSRGVVPTLEERLKHEERAAGSGEGYDFPSSGVYTPWTSLDIGISSSPDHAISSDE
ncbi:MAG: hypothetical protein WBW88_01660 [Rhodothermales bacterium]